MDEEDRSEAIAFCEQVRPRLVGALSLYCGDVDVAEEHTHDALIKVWQDWDNVRSMSAPEAWVMRVALNGARSFFRRRSAERRAMSRAVAGPMKGASLDEYEDLNVRSAVASLPARQRTAVVLRYYLDMSIDDAATCMGCRPGTVKSLTSKAVAALRRMQEIQEVSG